MAKATGSIVINANPDTNGAEIFIDDGQGTSMSQVTFVASTSTSAPSVFSRGADVGNDINLGLRWQTSTSNTRPELYMRLGGTSMSGQYSGFPTDWGLDGTRPAKLVISDTVGSRISITFSTSTSGTSGTAIFTGTNSQARKVSTGVYEVKGDVAYGGSTGGMGYVTYAIGKCIQDAIDNDGFDIDWEAKNSSGSNLSKSSSDGNLSYYVLYLYAPNPSDAGNEHAGIAVGLERASGSWTASSGTDFMTVAWGASSSAFGGTSRLASIDGPNEASYATKVAPYDVGGGTLTDAELAEQLKILINALPIAISASVSSTTVSLTNDNHGTEGNVTITTTDSTNFSVSGMSGGAAEGGGPAVAKRLKISARQIAISGSGGLSGSADGKSALMLDLAGLAAASIAQTDVLAFADVGSSNLPKKITFSDFEDAVFANISGDATVAAGGVLSITASAISASMLNNNVISGQTELASDGLAAEDELLISDGGTVKKIGVDNLMKDGLGLLGEEAVAVGSDHIVFLDGGASGDAKVESIADLATAMAAGAGLAASSGVIGVDGVLEDLDTLGAASADGEFIVATGPGAFAYESGNTARTSLGLGTGDSPVFTDLTLTGDLIVGGTTTSVNVTNLHVEDVIIGLGISGSTEGTAGDRGLIMHIASETNPAMFWDESENQFAFVRTNSTSSATTITADSYADLRVSALTASAGATIASLKVEDLTSGRVVLAGTGGEIEDSANMTFDGSLLTVTGDISASSDIYAAGAITASFFSGDGSGLSGVGAGVAEGSAGGDAGGNALQLTFVSGAASAASFFINSGSLQWRPSTDTLETVNISGSGGLDIAGTADFAAAVNVQGLLSGSGGMDIAGTADFGGAVNVQGLLSGSGGMDMAGTADFGGAVNIQGLLKPDGAADAAFDTSKSLFFRDSDGSMKRDSFSDIMAAAAGAGIQDAAGVLSIKSRQDVFTLTASIALSGSGPLVMKETPATTGSVMVFFNGLLQTQAVDYSLGGTGNKTVSLKGANTLAAEDEVVIKYIKS